MRGGTAWLAAVWAILLAACTGGGGGGDSSGGTAGNAPACSSALPCSDGFDCVSGRCVAAAGPSAGTSPAPDPVFPTSPPAACAECSAQQICVDGECQDVPRQCPCPVETYCDP